MKNSDKTNSSDMVTISLDRETAANLLYALTVGLNPDDYAWQLTNAPDASSRTDDIWFADENVGWLVNSSGFVCKTSDGGDSWDPQLFVPPRGRAKPYLRTIQFANHEIGWFGALCQAPEHYRESLLHHTVDGGATWTVVDNLPENAPQGICGLAVVNENVVYGSGSNDPDLIGPAVIKTVNGGESWTVIDMSAHAANLIDIWFFDENRGFVVGGRKRDTCPKDNPAYKSHPQYAQLKPVVLYTEDGGQTWIDRVASMTDEFDCGSWGWKLFWLDEQRGFVSIEDFQHGAILKTSDGGVNWSFHRINDFRTNAEGQVMSNANLEGIGFLDENIGWVGGWGDQNFIGNYNSMTVDGGLNWTAQDHVPSDPSSDPRVNVNRYRFIGNPVTVGYCSGVTVYKLVVNNSADGDGDDGGASGGKEGGKEGDDKAGDGPKFKTSIDVFADAPGASAGTASATTASEGGGEPIGLTCTPDDAEGSVAIHYEVPAGTDVTYVGIWSHFGWHVRTLLDERSPESGCRTVIWDGKDEHGAALHGAAFICRVMCDSTCESLGVQLA